MINESEALQPVERQALEPMEQPTDSLVVLADQADRRIAAIKRIKHAALAVTNPQDWVDMSGKPYLQATGAEKVARIFGISWRISEPTLEHEDDGHFTYTYTGIFALQSGVDIQAVGSRCSRDPFFTTRYEGRGENRRRVELEPREVDKTDVKKSAFTNLLTNGITRLLGLRNLTWEDIEGATEIRREATSSVEYAGQPVSEEVRQKRDQINGMILEMVSGDVEAAQDLLERVTSFRGRDGIVPGKRNVAGLSEKATHVTHDKVRAMHQKWQQEQFGEGSPEKAVPPNEQADASPFDSESAEGEAPKASTGRSLATLKSFSDFYLACWNDFNLRQDRLFAMLNVKNQAELAGTPAECYERIARAVKAQRDYEELRPEKAELPGAENW